MTVHSQNLWFVSHYYHLAIFFRAKRLFYAARTANRSKMDGLFVIPVEWRMVSGRFHGILDSFELSCSGWPRMCTWKSTAHSSPLARADFMAFPVFPSFSCCSSCACGTWGPSLESSWKSLYLGLLEVTFRRDKCVWRVNLEDVWNGPLWTLCLGNGVFPESLD